MTEPRPVFVREAQLEPGILGWTLARPDRRNAVDPRTLDWIARRCGQLAGEVVVLTGEGPDVFCAGFDLDALPSDAPTEPVAAAGSADASSTDPLPDEPLIRATAAMTDADATFVAAMQGHAIGAGVELVCACDVRLAARGAELWIPAGRLGLVYHAGGTARFHRVLGAGLTRRLLLLGDRVTAEEVLATGGFDAVVSPTELTVVAGDVARSLAATAPASLRGNRLLLRALDSAPLSDAVRTEHERLRRAAWSSRDHHEARLAARPPPPRAGPRSDEPKQG